MGHEPGFTLPVLTTGLRRSREGTDLWDELGPITLRVVPVSNPLPGHAPVAVVVEIATNLAPPWDGRERRQWTRQQ